MAPTRLRLENIGPIREAEVELADLTVLVGPQASGKSIFLQFLKLMLDAGPIFHTLRKYGFDWDKKPRSFLDLYLGEGMRQVWQPSSSKLTWNGKAVSLDKMVASARRAGHEKCFFIPAQRVLSLSQSGWLKLFTDYLPQDPFAIRDFSEKLRIMMQAGMGSGKAVYPQPKRLKGPIRDLLSKNIFNGWHLELHKQGNQRRLVLHDPGTGQPSASRPRLPFMVWSAGQREFVPLLLGLYWLLPPTAVARRGNVEWVIIEELEMGLHPRAIEAMMLIVLELLWRGYRVCLSTHSTHVLDLVWALRTLREYRGEARSLLDLFGVRAAPPMLKVAESALAKETRVYYFDHPSGVARDISNLDPAAPYKMEAFWGGLTEFSGRVADLVAKAVSSGQA